MSETRVVYQTAFAGLAEDQVAGDVPERCRVMLDSRPETRLDYTLAYFTYLDIYHDLDWNLRTRIASTNDLIRYLTAAGIPSFRTVANRCQELMRADASLKPPLQVEAERQRQRRQGRIK
jgi:hypothetical protein